MCLAEAIFFSLLPLFVSLCPLCLSVSLPPSLLLSFITCRHNTHTHTHTHTHTLDRMPPKRSTGSAKISAAAVKVRLIASRMQGIILCSTETHPGATTRMLPSTNQIILLSPAYKRQLRALFFSGQWTFRYKLHYIPPHRSSQLFTLPSKAANQQ